MNRREFIMLLGGTAGLELLEEVSALIACHPTLMIQGTASTGRKLQQTSQDPDIAAGPLNQECAFDLTFGLCALNESQAGVQSLSRNLHRRAIWRCGRYPCKRTRKRFGKGDRGVAKEVDAVNQ
jgi:hypothetical protein